MGRENMWERRAAEMWRLRPPRKRARRKVCRMLRVTRF